MADQRVLMANNNPSTMTTIPMLTAHVNTHAPDATGDNSVNTDNNSNSNKKRNIKQEEGVKRERKVRKVSKLACVNCRKAHTACSETRPCQRCQDQGLECIDGMRTVFQNVCVCV